MQDQLHTSPWRLSFEVESAVVSIVGRDFPKDYLEELADRNINMEGVEIDNTGDTFYWKGRYHKDINRRDTLVTDSTP
ncbi:MAG: hypothetical protein CM15mP83_2120 [Flavobacteriaceae bacterium]|nr:MAG: hypothetical protein CM15mP83_2120 [Flavobacteriaceae bacterium]